MNPRSDDAALRLARILSDLGAPATFKMVGEKLRSLKRLALQFSPELRRSQATRKCAASHTQAPRMVTFQSAAAIAPPASVGANSLIEYCGCSRAGVQPAQTVEGARMSNKVRKGKNAIGLVAAGTINGIGLAATSYVNAIGLAALSVINSIGFVAIGGVSAIGIVAIGGVNTIGVVAIGGVNAMGVIAVGGINSRSILPGLD